MAAIGLAAQDTCLQDACYCAGGAICNGVERAWPLSTPGGWRVGGAPCGGFRVRAAGSAEAVVSCDCCAAAGSEVMMLTGGIEEEDGKNSLLSGLAAATGGG